VWWGVSVENQKHGLPRIDHLRTAPAAVRFLSVEPLLEDLGEVNLTDIHWMIVGGESGAGARPMQPEWVRALRDQCRAANVAFFFKQWGGVRKSETGRKLDRRTHDEQPEEGQRTEMPARRIRLALVEEGQWNQRVNPPPHPHLSRDLTPANPSRKNPRRMTNGSMLQGSSTPTNPTVTPMSQVDTNPEYWREYSNLQRVKHELIREYLKGWFPKMTLGGCRRLLYIDTHAGRGTHLSGQLGSPLIALHTLLGHQSRDRMLQNCEVRFFFFERDDENYTALGEELKSQEIPKNVFVEPRVGDCFEIMGAEIAAIEKTDKRLAPSFVFVDPYGFKLPSNLLRKLLSYSKVELFVNVIWRELDMAIQIACGKDVAEQTESPRGLFENPHDLDQTKAERKEKRAKSFQATLNRLFDSESWRTINADHADGRAEQCAKLFREMTGAKWGTHLRMLDDGRIRYFLLHLTNHDAGRDLMKDAMWMACPDGGFAASKSDNPQQQLLIQREPDFKPLRDWITARLAAKPAHWEQLATLLRDELWREPQLNDALRAMRKEGLIAARGTFGRTQNPRISLAT
jgi:three-Cys-motif partner protein